MSATEARKALLTKLISDTYDLNPDVRAMAIRREERVDRLGREKELVYWKGSSHLWAATAFLWLANNYVDGWWILIPLVSYTVATFLIFRWRRKHHQEIDRKVTKILCWHQKRSRR